MGPEYVETSGTGTVAVVPDRAVLRLRLVETADDIAAALEACAGRVHAVLDALEEAAGEHVRQTGALGLSDHWDDKRQVQSGYDATQTLVVRLSDPARIGTVIAAAAAATGPSLRLDGLSWAASDVAGTEREARDLALASAREKAEQLATAGGRTLGPLLRVREGEAGGGPVQLMAKRASAAPLSMPAEAGESEVSVAVTARWVLAD